jgi:fluoroquinolone transport system permease protein
VLSRRLLTLLLLNASIQARHLFPQIYLGLTVTYALVLRALRLGAWYELLVPVMLFSEPGLMGMMFVGAQVFFERSQGSDLATAVTPALPRETVLGKALSIAALATLAGLLLVGLTLPARGPAALAAALAALAPVLLLTATTFGLAGVALAARRGDFTRFLFVAIAVATPLLLPAAAALGAFGRGWLAWLPSAPLIYAADMLYRAAASPAFPVGAGATETAAASAALLLAIPQAAWTLAAARWAARSYEAHMRGSAAPRDHGRDGYQV